VCQISKFLATKPLTINQLSLSENALKLTYGNVEFQNFPGRTPDPRSKGREREGGKSGRGGEGRGWGGRKGRGGREGLKEREGKERGEKEEGKGRGIWTPDVPDRSTPLFVTFYAWLVALLALSFPFILFSCSPPQVKRVNRFPWLMAQTMRFHPRKCLFGVSLKKI
jgi:hypothetical protein